MSLLTPEDLETIISRVLGPNFKILSHRLEPFSKLKNGLLGTHYILSIEVQDGRNKDNSKIHTFFAKTQPDSPIILDSIMEESMFLEEVNFYNEIQPGMIENYNGEKWSPRCYLANRQILVFEDLREQGYTIRPSMFFDTESLKSALATLARFHASSILAEKRLGKTLAEAYPNSFYEKVYSKTCKFAEPTVVSYDAVAKLAKRFGLDSSLTSKIYDKVYKLVRPVEGRYNVICHSDLWKNNLMFHDDNTPAKCILVDYQLLRYASPMIDMTMLLYLHTTPEFRKKFKYDMFEHYYSALRETLVQNNSKAEVPSYEDLLMDYKEHRIVGMAYASQYLPGIYLKTEELNKLMNDPEALAEWFLDHKNKYGIIQKNLEEDPTYAKNIKDLIYEFMKEGERVCV